MEVFDKVYGEEAFEVLKDLDVFSSEWLKKQNYKFGLDIELNRFINNVNPFMNKKIILDDLDNINKRYNIYIDKKDNEISICDMESTLFITFSKDKYYCITYGINEEELRVNYYLEPIKKIEIKTYDEEIIFNFKNVNDKDFMGVYRFLLEANNYLEENFIANIEANKTRKLSKNN